MLALFLARVVGLTFCDISCEIFSKESDSGKFSFRVLRMVLGVENMELDGLLYLLFGVFVLGYLDGLFYLLFGVFVLGYLVTCFEIQRMQIYVIVLLRLLEPHQKTKKKKKIGSTPV
eukprot:TRINITY_DN5715_c0_g1_i1.p3 TRINITY_DN5715_c0_g1~~TRINITY_DN5715_c0_g1_i1.p3  ORF type:complete len:117 (+),score=9.54 TRINITY_DN5715_c0_g1_i1:262-612(+)